MYRVLRISQWAAAAIAVLVSQQASADLTVVEDADGLQGLTVFRMTVTPAAEPVPALKHRFVTPLHERKPGNAATHYLRSYGELSPNGRWRRITDRYGEEVEDWYRLETPINELRRDVVAEVIPMFRKLADRFIQPATRCRRCDWGIEEMDLRGLETISYILSDAQETRSISRGLALVARYDIAHGRYDNAIDYIRMNYQLGQDVSKQRFVVCCLIGMAEVGMANSGVIDLISAPDSPSLYWALSELPRPIVDIRESMNLEMSLGLRMFPALLDVDQVEHAPEEWARLIETTLNSLDASLDMLGRTEFPEDETLAQLGATGLALFVYPAAKQRLIDSGRSVEEVEAMPVAQVLLVDTAREYKRIADDFEKWTFVPYRQLPRIDVPRPKLEDGFGGVLADLLLPAVRAVRTAQMRVQWRIDALRVVEAIRMHAAETSELPQSLEQIRVVPVPINPLTEKPYLYRLAGKTAILELPFSDGIPGAAWRFEIELAR